MYGTKIGKQKKRVQMTIHMTTKEYRRLEKAGKIEDSLDAVFGKQTRSTRKFGSVL